MKISEIFNLKATQYQLDFVDVDINKDYPLYIDPFLISNINNSWAVEANIVLKSFFSEFKEAMINGDYEKVKYLFSYVSEPKETCLGTNSVGTDRGKGVSTGNTDEIISSIIKSKAIENKLVQNIEDMRIFVDGIDRDKTSDIVTNIIRKKLIEYTNEQCDFWGIPMEKGESLPYWDVDDNRWVYSDERLLIVENKEILLIPKAIVSRMSVYSSDKYKWYYIVEQERRFHLQRRSEIVHYKTLKSGEQKPVLYKKEVDQYIKKEIEESYIGNKDYIRQYTQKHPELFKAFANQCNKQAKSLNTGELLKYIEECEIDTIIDNLIDELKGIPTGRDYATKYHHYIKGLLGLIFYPLLVNPAIEQEIHDGRKRIDITMQNNASKGFFYNLHNISKIFCPYILIECKNYGKDIVNPEIDQLAGRFSPKRGEFGLLICREIQNEDLLTNRCIDTYHDNRGLILYLTDKDLIEMLEMIKTGNEEQREIILEKKKRSIVIA